MEAGFLFAHDDSDYVYVTDVTECWLMSVLKIKNVLHRIHKNKI
jgi:hypothetical protein